MKIALLRLDGFDVAMIAASTCVSDSIPTEPKPEGLTKALRSGHDSLLEHIVVSFAVEGISRVCLAQLSRHRHITLAVRSQRYVRLNPVDLHVPSAVKQDAVALEDFSASATDCARSYARMIDDLGIDQEDARYILPEGTMTDLIMTCNLCEFSHMCGLRRCNRAQAEIHRLFDGMEEQVRYALYCAMPDLLHRSGPYQDLYLLLVKRMAPQCVRLGYCPEVRTCGLVPSLDDLWKAYDASHREVEG